MTALTPDLIRAWEKRYAVVAPIRGARGARLYTLRDIAHLRQLARVVASGRAIGDVAALPPTMLQRLATRGGPDPVVAETRAAPARARFRTQVLEHLQSFDQAAIARLLGDAVVALGARAFVREIAEPLVHDVGARWAEGELSIAQEHLLIAALRNLLAALLREQTPAGRPMVLATPAGERHEVGLLLVALLAADAGVNVINLGVDLPAADIAAVAARVRARVVGLSVVGKANRRRAAGEVAAIQLALSPSSELWLGGTDAGGVARVAHFRGLTVTSAAMTETELRRIGKVDRA